MNRVISGYSRESCYFGYFGSFQVISVRILNFGVFRFMELIFFNFSCRSRHVLVRSLRSLWVGGVEFHFFFRFMGKFIKKSLHSGSIRKSCYFGLFRVISGHFVNRLVAS